MEPSIVFRRVNWEDLSHFLHLEACKINRDVDQDVRYMTYEMFCSQCVEGIYVDGLMVGFTRWDPRNGHLSNLYVMPEARGQGLAKRYIDERPIKSLYVIPHNHAAKRLYTALGFQQQISHAPTRDYMTR